VRDILLDQNELDRASREMESLSSDVVNFKNTIEGLLDNLLIGFNTPAGRQFVATSREGVLNQLEQQAASIEHVANNLTEARDMYQSVFEEFASLNNNIRNRN